MPSYTQLPEVDTSSLSRINLDSVDSSKVTNDYGTPNLVFLYYIPSVTDEKKNDLAAVQKEFHSWNAWELAAAEDQLQKQLTKGTLPSDDSAESRATRTNYRAKVLAYLRENSEDSWLLSHQNPDSDPFNKVVKKAEVNGVIRQVIRGHYETAKKPRQMAVLLNVLSDIAAANPNTANKYYVTEVYYNWDSTVKAFRPDIQVSSFTVTQTPEKEKKDSVTLNVDILDYAFSLDRSGWDEVSDGAHAAIEAGEKIRREMALDVYLETKDV